jgi:hypothetical protein
MKLKDIITIADKAYPDGLMNSAEQGDRLAQFIKMELRETYDAKASTKEQLKEAERCIDVAYWQLKLIGDAFDRASR